MNIYRFSITQPDNEDFERVIDVPSDWTFEQFHKTILASVEFDFEQLASFYICNDEWQKGDEITLIDMHDEEDGKLLFMGEHHLSEFVKKVGDKLSYLYDFVLMWEFKIELVKIESSTKKGEKFPKLFSSKGENPDQYGKEDLYPSHFTDATDDELIRELTTKNHEALNHDDIFDGEEVFDENEGELEEDEFGFGEGDGYDKEDLY